MITARIEFGRVDHVVVDATTDMADLASLWVALEPGTGFAVLVATGKWGYELLAERGFARVGFIALADITIADIISRRDEAAA